jgi:parvulin-like peptidyl-prolyl isomerase
MRAFLFPSLLFAVAAWAQSAAPQAVPPAPTLPDLPPDTVVASFGNGEKLTAGELKGFIAAMPPQMQQSALRDRKAFVQQFALMHRLAEMAEQAKLDQQSPTRESLAFNRMYLLMNAQLHEKMSSITVAPADVQAFYDQNKDRFTQVKVKAIYVSFSSNPQPDSDGKKHLTEAEAQARIEKLRAALVGGADFVKLVKENSEDTTSAAKDGDFGVIRRTDNLPDAIRKAIFALKAGELSEPVRQPNGFYLFRAEELSPQPFSDVHEAISDELKQARFKEWMDATTGALHLKLENETFFAGGQGTAASP